MMTMTSFGLQLCLGAGLPDLIEISRLGSLQSQALEVEALEDGENMGAGRFANLA